MARLGTNTADGPHADIKESGEVRNYPIANIGTSRNQV